MKEKTFLSIGGVKAPLYEYCRIYKLDANDVMDKARQTGMPASKVFCDELQKRGIEIDRSRVKSETSYEINEYIDGLKAQALKNIKEPPHRKRYDVEYFRPYGAAAGEWRVEKNITSERLNEVVTFARNLYVKERK